MLASILALIVVASQPAAPDVFVLTGHQGIVHLHDGRKVAGDIETIAPEVSGDGIVGTRGHEILVVPFDGDAARTVYRHNAEVRFATLNSDASMLAFSSDGEIDLSIRDRDGVFSKAESLTAGYGPSFSSDNTFIYFENGDSLWRIELSSKKVQQFLPDYRGAHTVRCSRDGRFIAFSMNRALYLYRTTDKTVNRLTRGDAYDRFPAFAGDEIYFFREAREGREVMSIRVDGTHETSVFQGDVELICTK